ncbi:uncharacterized protein [Haliotis asinina]|uniref:uncharacterized protein n=1 Tax=Haliotis asinina TaxID=109174 RepID=UPI003531AE7A
MKPLTSPQVIGGLGTISLNITCVVPPDGVTATPDIQVNMVSPLSPTVESHPFTAVTMILSKSDPTTTTVTEVTQATLGEHLYLVIKSEVKAAGGDNVLIPESCSATGGNDTVDLWTLNPSGGASCGSLQTTLFGNFTVDRKVVQLRGKNEDITFADLYAFKFKTSATITYKCTVLVCPKGSNGQCNNELTSVRNQKCFKTIKRRSVESKSVVPHVRKTVSATLTVSDFHGLSEGSQTRVEGVMLLVAMLTSLLLSK